MGGGGGRWVGSGIEGVDGGWVEGEEDGRRRGERREGQIGENEEKQKAKTRQNGMVVLVRENMTG